MAEKKDDLLTHLLNESGTTVFVEQPLALPGSDNNLAVRPFPADTSLHIRPTRQSALTLWLLIPCLFLGAVPEQSSLSDDGINDQITERVT